MLAFVRAGTLRGQTGYPVDSLRAAVGRRVRVRSSDSSAWLRGTLASVNDSAVIVRTRDDTRFLALRDLAEAQRSRGHDRVDDGLAGLFMGLPAGALIGLAIGTYQAHTSRSEFRDLNVPLGVIASAIGGSVLGSVIGAAISPERWVDIGHEQR